MPRILSEPRSAAPGRGARALRPWVLWSALVGLLLVGQSLLVALTLKFEERQALERAEMVATGSAAEIRRVVILRLQAIQTAEVLGGGGIRWIDAAQQLLQQYPEFARLERRGLNDGIETAVQRPFSPTLLLETHRLSQRSEGAQACTAALRDLSPQFSRTYFVPSSDGSGQEMIDVCLPIQREGRATGFIIATLPLVGLLQAAARNDDLYEFSFVEADGTRLARFGRLRGSNRHVVRRVLDLPGSGLELKVDSTQGSPGLLPTVTLSLVLALSIALTVVVALLLRDMRRRSLAEAALAESLAFRKAMENSLITGLRARDLQGRITYVNPAFCAMVGQPAQALLATGGAGDPDPPYWPPERVAEYRQRQSHRHLSAAEPTSDQRLPPTLQGFETVFLRASGERFPVLIYEAPLVDSSGQQSGWMSAVVDISEQQRSEEQVRVQQERLQATARLATMGEMASLLSHELNQPLAAIASYASGSLNLLRDPDAETLSMVRDAVGRMAEQAERAGRVIKSVHDFVRRREQARESMPVMQLFDAVLPLVRLQARKSGARVQVQVADPALRVLVDRTMLEQVLLNLTRNGIQAMERDTPVAERELLLRATGLAHGRVQVEVEDRGPGISAQVEARLFTPFFTTREDGMGLGLSLCRTVVEQHGSTLEYGPPATGRGCVFRFTVPQPRSAHKGDTSPHEPVIV